MRGTGGSPWRIGRKVLPLELVEEEGVEVVEHFDMRRDELVQMIHIGEQVQGMKEVHWKRRPAAGRTDGGILKEPMFPFS